MYMNDVTLYRKYRPSNFKEVIGQDHIVKALKGALSENNIPHALLLYGTRGIGKTSIARIFANELKTAPSDLYEIDAASNRGIDDIRDLRDSVHTLPFSSKYKIYIIDEVHMLTKEAFNALLKTLEEPPAHVIFILATTELEKLPETIVSRCQTHTFKKPSQRVLAELVKKVGEKEGYTMDAGVANLIALLGDGSFRDTLGVTQKVLSSSADKKISTKEAEAITGAPPRALIEELITSIIEKKLDVALNIVARAVDNNISMKMFLNLILATMRQILLVKFSPNMKEVFKEQLDEESLQFIIEKGNSASQAISSKTLLVLLDAYTQTGHAHITQLPLELALISLLSEKHD